MGRDSNNLSVELRIRKAQNQLSAVYAADRFRLKRRINQIRRLWSPKTIQKIVPQLDRLEQDVKASIKRRHWRQTNLPQAVYPDAILPILSKKKEIVSAIKKYPVVIISGDTGSGKTTQIPKFCLEARRGVDGAIGCTQPRRIAATTVARRIAQELDVQLGDKIGYKIRFRDRTSKNGFIKIMTDGILLAELQGDPFLNNYDTLIIDEAHERSLNIDLSLGIIKRLLPRRKNLKLIITSATIDTEKFSTAFNKAPIIEVAGRMFPVEVRYENASDIGNHEEAAPVETAVAAVTRLLQRSRLGDILVFMPTEKDIRDACRILEGRADSHITIFPLFSRLAAKEQTKIFSTIKGRKVIIATNIAETSITIPGIKYVVDTGLARISRYTPRSRCTLLPVVPISRSSADQRKGRCGRVAEGVCIRLYSEEDYLSRPFFTVPEILRANLGHVILQMIALKLGDVNDFPFIDPPSPKHVQDGFRLLTELGALKQSQRKNKKASTSPQLTSAGKQMVRLPIDPRVSRILIEAKKEGCLAEVLVIAAVLSIQDPRERPSEMQESADAAHAEWTDYQSDFITFLNIWRWYKEKVAVGKSVRKMKRHCHRRFLSYRRMREWEDIHGQLLSLLNESGSPVGALPDSNSLTKPAGGGFSPRYAAVHRSILSGFLSNIALKKENHVYTGAGGRELMIFPGSGQFDRSSKWIVAADWVQTSRLFARVVARIDPDWLEPLGKDLCKYAYHNPRWDRNRETVIASEQVSLFGLVIASDRARVYGKIDAEKSSDIFINDALVAADLKKPMAFVRYNQAKIEQVMDLENRMRRKDFFVGPAAVAAFYHSHLKGIWNIGLLKKKIKAAGDDHFLRLKKEDLMRFHPEDSLVSGFPDHLRMGIGTYPCHYVYQPGDPADGLSVVIPSAAAASVPLGAVDWLVPGYLTDKLKALVKGLPKDIRRRLGPVPQAIDKIYNQLNGYQSETPLTNVVSDLIFRLFGIHIPAHYWPWEDLPDYLKMRIVIVNSKGDAIVHSRDPAVLCRSYKTAGHPNGIAHLKDKWERSEISNWNIGRIPTVLHDTCDEVFTQRKKEQANLQSFAYPALTAHPQTPGKVSLRLYASQAKAEKAHRQGIKQLAIINLPKEVKHLKRTLKVPVKWHAAAALLGGSSALEHQMVDKILTDSFAKPIRTEKAFNACTKMVGPKLYRMGQDLLGVVTPILSTFSETYNRLTNGLSRHLGNRPITEFINHRQSDLMRLVPNNFIALYTNDRLTLLPLYIQAISVRTQRGSVDLQKDRQKMEKVKNFTNQLDTALEGLSATTSEMKREALENFFWNLETYKVSVFAQELKGLSSISAKLLEENLLEIERMV